MSTTPIMSVGMGGWDLPDFNGVFYPQTPGRGFRKLAYYSMFFDFVELNASFYNPSFTLRQIRQWTEDVSGNPKFRIAVKLFKGFTHDGTVRERDVVGVQRLLSALADVNLLTGVLAQFPYSYRNTEDHRAHLLTLCKLFHQHRLFVEVRHNSWNTDPFFKMLQDGGAHPVNVDLPAIKRHMPLMDRAQGDIAYYRMMGRNAVSWDRPWVIDEVKRVAVSERYSYQYSGQELDDLARRIERQTGASFVVFHNDPQAQSLLNGFQLWRKIEPDRTLLIPERLMKTFPALSRLNPAIAHERPLFAEHGERR